MFGDSFVLWVIAAIALFVAFIAISFWPRILKVVGYMFVVVGLWAAYMCFRYIFELTVGNVLH
jgi:protein-S-isoprenylcysteine O-methyltransferase Ste14